MLFTFVTEFRGGTYVHQIRARSVGAAKLAWADQLVERRINMPYLGSTGAMRLQQRLRRGEVHEIPVAGVTGVWFMHFQSNGGSLFVNVVRTAH